MTVGAKSGHRYYRGYRFEVTDHIPRTVKLSEAPSFGQPITQYDPKGRGALSYIELAKEVIARG